MVMDKGLSLRQAEDFLEVNADKVDLLKLGFGTSIVTPNVKEKIKLYHDAGLMVYPGGTLFEAYFVRNQMDDFLRYIDHLGLEPLEVSDGSMVSTMPAEILVSSHAVCDGGSVSWMPSPCP